LLPANYTAVLEVGCGEAGFRQLLKPTCEYWGIEPNHVAATRASGQGAHILTGTYEDVASSLPTYYFDLVICNDVIEHMSDHDWFLDDIRTRMRAKAALIGSVPNVRYYATLWEILVLRDWRYRASGILDRTHKRWFTFKSLRRTLGEHGFTIECIRGVNGALRLKPASCTLKTLGRLPKYVVRHVIFWPIMILSGGLLWDTQYAQIAFRCWKR